VLGTLPADLAVQEADRLGQAVYDYVPAMRQAAESMAEELLLQIEEYSQQEKTPVS
jgi:hypothetical protein